MATVGLPARLDWDPVVQGDRMEPEHIRLTEDGVALAVTHAAMQVRDASGALLLDWATDGDGLALVDGPGGHVQVGPWDMTIEPGVHFYDFQVDTVLYGRKTVFVGAFPVLAQATR